MRKQIGITSLHRQREVTLVRAVPCDIKAVGAGVIQIRRRWLGVQRRDDCGGKATASMTSCTKQMDRMILCFWTIRAELLDLLLWESGCRSSVFR